jgi:hypothetical protein
MCMPFKSIKKKTTTRTTQFTSIINFSAPKPIHILLAYDEQPRTVERKNFIFKFITLKGKVPNSLCFIMIFVFVVPFMQ